MTKDELIAQNAILTENIQAKIDSDAYLREQFSEAFKLFEVGIDYGFSTGTKKLKKLSWEEIFVEIGKLLSLRDFRDFDGNISELECAVEDLRKTINDQQVVK